MTNEALSHQIQQENVTRTKKIHKLCIIEHKAEVWGKKTSLQDIN